MVKPWLRCLVAVAAFASAISLATESPGKPVIAVVAQNGGTEPTDYLVPFGVLAGSGLVDVRAIAVSEGPVHLHPSDAMLDVQGTIGEFDAEFPRGASYVIVPAVHDPKEARLLNWLRAQRQRGAVIMSICDGAKVLASAGLLEGREATAHWYALDDLRSDFKGVRWRNDRRYVFDEGVATTAGVSASIPATLALLERIAGAEATLQYARKLGFEAWPPEHDGAAFKLSGAALRTATANTAAFWRRERLELALPPDVDEASASLVLDAYSRTYRSTVVVSAKTPTVRTRHGLMLHASKKHADRAIANDLVREPLERVLDATLAAIESDYGAPTARFVALQLEYPQRATTSP